MSPQRRRAVLRAMAYYGWLLVAFIIPIYFGLGVIVAACGIFLLANATSLGRALFVRRRAARAPGDEADAPAAGA